MPETFELLRSLEEKLLQPLVRKGADELSVLLADDFLEIGSSGRIFDRTAVINELADEAPAPRIVMTDFEMEMLAPGVALVRYRTSRQDAQGTKQSHRSSIWIYRDARWQIKFHQGTPIATP